MSRKPFIVPVFIPHIGCPHRCVFCNQKSITGSRNDRPSPDQIKEQISEFLGFKGDNRGRVEVAFYGGNFLGLNTSYRHSLLKQAQEFVNAGRIDSIRFSTRPDTISSTSLEELAPYTVGTVEIGLQSMDDKVLTMSRRGHSANATIRAVEILRNRGLNVGLQIMPGLPGDMLQSILETGNSVVKLKPDFVRIYPTVVIRDTVLEKWYNSGKFQPLSLDEAVDVTKRLYLLFEGQGISVIRIGLHAGSSLLEPGNIVAGPFHPAFGHLVHSAVFFDLAARKLETQNDIAKRVKLMVHPKDVSKAIGLKKENINRLIAQFGLEKLCVVSDRKIPRDTLKIANW